ncbi:heme peroxidase family protein [Archangium sp.]|uniref:peroxidase family protein n=1 Tax=Archangium sp. TaxID=1872627 RepID=UPI00286AA4BC|nr:heme peroxidase family protein [Archangium sp.]
MPAFAPDNPVIRDKLLELGAVGGPMDGSNPATNVDNETIPAGFTFLGQFIDHDLTFDPTSILERQNDPEAIENFRTPALELDNVYGSGPRASRHLYDVNNPAKFLVEKLDGPGSQDDMPRNSQMTALIGDPRNDENVIVSQLHVAVLKFHNAIVDHLVAEGIEESQVFEQAQRMVRWHYQWIIVHEFLPKLVGESLVKDVLRMHHGDRLFQWRNEPFIPVEFSVAAYRFGHSQVRPGYKLNGPQGGGFAAGFFGNPAAGTPEDPNDLRGGKRARRRFVEWDNFFINNNNTPQLSKKIDTLLSSPLFTMPPGAPGTQSAGSASLAARNLQRGLALGLPSGQAMAQRLRVKALKADHLDDLSQFKVGFERSTPPWFYMLREADVFSKGEKLGPVGARIVAEVFIGMLQGDRQSFLNANPNWRPELANAKGEFNILDLLKFAGVPLSAPPAQPAPPTPPAP